MASFSIPKTPTTPTPSPSQAYKGYASISGVAVLINERVPDPKKAFSHIHNGQVYLPGTTVEDSLGAIFRVFNDGSLDLDFPAGCFINAQIGLIDPNNPKHKTLFSDGLTAKDYGLVGDITTVIPVTNFKECDCVSPLHVPSITVTGVVSNVVETDKHIVYSILLEQYLPSVEGQAKLSVDVVLDLQSPRWKPGTNNEGKVTKRTPWVKAGTFITTSGRLMGVKRDNEIVTCLEMSAEVVVVAGKSPLLPTLSNSQLADSPLKGKEASNGRFSLGSFAQSRKRKRTDN